MAGFRLPLRSDFPDLPAFQPIDRFHFAYPRCGFDGNLPNALCSQLRTPLI